MNFTGVAVSDSPETQTFIQLPEEKQDRIVSASIEEFAERGYESASMNRVVASANISKGALFKYFQTKQGLFTYVYRRAFTHVKNYLRDVRDTSGDEDFYTRLEKIMGAGVKFIRSHPRMARIYYRLLYTGDAPHHIEILQELHMESLKFIRSVIQDGIQRGDLRQDLNVDASAFMIESILDRFLQAHQQEFLDPSLGLFQADPGESERWIQDLIQIFREGLGSADTASPGKV